MVQIPSLRKTSANVGLPCCWYLILATHNVPWAPDFTVAHILYIMERIRVIDF